MWLFLSNFFRFFFIVFVSVMVMKWIVMPVFYALLIAPALKLSNSKPRSATAIVLLSTPFAWGINVVWLGYIAWLTRIYVHSGSLWVAPIYLLFGMSGAMYIFNQSPKETPIWLMWAGVWCVLLIAMFIVVRPI
jgi:hypothetical protein